MFSVRILGLLIGLCWILGLFVSTVRAMKCEFCNKDFTCVKRHTWRCRARITSSNAQVSAPVPNNNVIDNLLKDPIRNTTGQEEVLNKETQWLECVCGKRCKGRRGLRKHQGTCRTNKLLMVGERDMSHRETSEEDQPKNSEVSDRDDLTELLNVDVRPNACPSDTDYPSTLPVVHLPKSASEWEEANAFFRAAFSAASFLSIENLDDFTNIFQNTIYNYFAENYGTTSERKTDEKELDAMSVKELKKKLSGLKKFGEKGRKYMVSENSSEVSKLRGHTNTANPQPEKQEPPAA